MPVPMSAADRAAALDHLLRPEPRRRPLFRTGVAVPGSSVASATGDAGGNGGVGTDEGVAPGKATMAAPAVRRHRPVAAAQGAGPSWWPPRWSPAGPSLPAVPPAALVAAVVAVVVLAVVAWPWLRRPAPADSALPRAGSDPATEALAEPPADNGAPTTAAAPTGAVGAASAGPSAAGPSSGPSSGSPVTVHVAGAVASPGVVTLPAGSRVVDAVAAAGGLRPDSDTDRVNLAAPVVDGSRVLVPVLGQPVPADAGAVVPGGVDDGGSAPAAATGGAAGPAGPVDLNTADAAQLEELPGVGPATAAAIIDHRESSGPFRSVEDLLDVRGIGEAKLGALRDLVVAGP